MTKNSEYIFYFKNGHLCRFKPGAKKRKTLGLSANNKPIKHQGIKGAKYVKKINVKDKQEVLKTLKDFENENKAKKIEYAMVILENGEVYTCEGNKNTVPIGDIFKGKLKNACISHNHPIEETNYSFSNEDFTTFNEYELKLLKGVDEKYTYELTREAKNVDDEPDEWRTREDYQHSVIIGKAKEFGVGYRRWKND